MVIRMARLLGGIVLVSALFHLLAPSAATTPLPRHANLRTYRFTARITNNDGVTPFTVGKVITGTFTYDLKGKNKRPNGVDYGSYESIRNSLAFQLGDLRFTGAGEVLITVATFQHAEHFGIVAFDLQLPKGWEMDHTVRSQSYGIILQNVPPRNVIPRAAIPDRLSLSDFKNTRELRLDFFHGVRFPGGAVKKRATVFTVIETLEEIRR